MDEEITQEFPRPGIADALEPAQHPAPWWYRFLVWLWPSRCREIPEAVNPGRVVLRQFAIVKGRWYLQQFASAEDPRFMHSHPFRFMFAIGLWGSYIERRIAGAPRRRRAPYLYTLDGGHVHHVQAPSRGHTSLFLGFGRAADGSEGDKRYFGTPVDGASDGLGPETRAALWYDHIREQVKRI